MVCLLRNRDRSIRRDEDCVRADTHQCGTCCMAHFLTGSRVNLDVLDQYSSMNTVCFGCDYPEYLTKRFPCSCYLDNREFSFIRDVEYEYSDTLPEVDVPIVRLSTRKFEERFKNCKEIPIIFKEGQAITNFASLVKRVLKGEGLEMDTINIDEEPHVSDELPVHELVVPHWIFCANMQWNRISSMKEFRGDPEYMLVFLVDGNLLRIKKHDVDANVVVRRQYEPPTVPPRASYKSIIKTQICIYRCLDGYFEYDPDASTTIHSRTQEIYPFKNKHVKTGLLGESARSLIRSNITQQIDAGQTNVATDVERGEELIDFIFSPEYEKRMRKHAKKRVITIQSSNCFRRKKESDSEYIASGSSESNVSSESEEESSRRGKPIAYARSTHPHGVRPRCLVKSSAGVLYSGVAGILYKKKGKHGVCSSPH